MYSAPNEAYITYFQTRIALRRVLGKGWKVSNSQGLNLVTGKAVLVPMVGKCLLFQ